MGRDKNIERKQEKNRSRYQQDDIIAIRKEIEMIACNNRPRVGDRTQGMWRRMLLVPWQVEITKEKRIRGMDKIEWWQDTGELPGIFRWAVVGLARLRQQRGFTESKKMNDALQDYQEESNPAKSFLKNHLQRDGNCNGIKTADLYWIYKKWAFENGHHPLSERTFGKEVKRVFHFCERKKGGPRSDRYWFYPEIKFSVDTICGQKTERLMKSEKEDNEIF